MKVIRVRNVHQALPEALYQLRNDGVKRSSRNGDVLAFPEPVTTVYRCPTERVIFHPERDANPFFHLFESLWMLAGHNDVDYVSQFVPRMMEYSDNKQELWGAYGYRWRNHYYYDQLNVIIQGLINNKDDRRQVLSMWDGRVDLSVSNKFKDIPCNLQAIFQESHEGRLDMTVTNRSNDMIWGCYGANAVHFSMLHEFMARCIGVPVGTYWQVSANLHAYLLVLPQVAVLADKAAYSLRVINHDNPYVDGDVCPYPLMSTNKDAWEADLHRFLSQDFSRDYVDPFFACVAQPMFNAWLSFKDKSNPNRHLEAMRLIELCEASDWRMACFEWLNRRVNRMQRAYDDGVTY